MKRVLIAALLLVNGALLAVLVVRSSDNVAQAQTVSGQTDYLMVTAKVTSDNDAVYVLDLASRRLAMWEFQMGKKQLVPYRGRALLTDFRRTEAK